VKSFLLNAKTNTPIIPWSLVPQGIFFEGTIPENHFLAVSPTSEKMVIVDIDCKPGKVSGYDNIPLHIMDELENTFHYKTKSGGMHSILHYTGDKLLRNGTSNVSIDLRIGPNKATGNNGGYVRWYSEIHPRDCEHLIEESSREMNDFLEKLFS